MCVNSHIDQGAAEAKGLAFVFFFPRFSFLFLSQCSLLALFFLALVPARCLYRPRSQSQPLSLALSISLLSTVRQTCLLITLSFNTFLSLTLSISLF